MSRADDYIDSKYALLTSIEQRVLESVAGALATAELDPTEENLGALNELLRAALARELFTLQLPLQSLVRSYNGGRPIAMRSPDELLALAEMDGRDIQAWLRRRSPSRWMAGLIGATAARIRNQAATLIASAIWSVADQTETQIFRGTGSWTWLTREDEKVCEICGPLNRQRFARRADVPSRHPQCRCSVLPTSGEVAT